MEVSRQALLPTVDVVALVGWSGLIGPMERTTLTLNVV